MNQERLLYLLYHKIPKWEFYTLHILLLLFERLGLHESFLERFDFNLSGFSSVCESLLLDENLSGLHGFFSVRILEASSKDLCHLVGVLQVRNLSGLSPHASTRVMEWM